MAINRGYIKSADGWRLYLPQHDNFMNLHKEINAMAKSDWQVYRIGKDERKREFMIKEKNKTASADISQLKKYNHGLIILSGGRYGVIGSNLLSEDNTSKINFVKSLKKIFLRLNIVMN